MKIGTIGQISFYAVSFLAMVIHLQDKPAAPEVSAQAKVNILQAKVAIMNTQSSYNTCQQTNWQGLFSTEQAEFQKAVDGAFDEAKVSKDDYDLNLDNLTFVKKAKKP
jgi:hypothetical protein